MFSVDKGIHIRVEPRDRGGMNPARQVELAALRFPADLDWPLLDQGYQLVRLHEALPDTYPPVYRKRAKLLAEATQLYHWERMAGNTLSLDSAKGEQGWSWASGLFGRLDLAEGESGRGLLDLAEGDPGFRAGAWRVTDSEHWTWPRVSRAGDRGGTDSEDWTWLRVSRAGAWRVTDSEDWTWPRASRDRAWRVTSLGRLFRLDRRTGQTVGPDRQGHLIRKS